MAPSSVDSMKRSIHAAGLALGCQRLILPPRRVAADSQSLQGVPNRKPGDLSRTYTVPVKGTLAMFPMASGPLPLLFGPPGKLLLPPLHN